MSACPVLIGSTFPLSLVRRRVTIEPASLEALRAAVKERGVASFWGHENTVAQASAQVGADLRPQSMRPAVRLTAEQLPSLEGRVFRECWVLSPDYRPGFRPALGEEVAAADITGWQVLRLRWED
jgi:hypothetical protein